MTNTYRALLALILAIYLVLAIGYGLTTPLFEAPDENSHYYTAAVIAKTRSLPQVDGDFTELTEQEAAQPPLYYLMAAVAATPFDVDLADDFFWPNPAVQLGAADSPQNINAFVHTELESWPWSDPVAIAHLWRLLSSILGLGTLLAIFGCARLVWPLNAERALLATAMVAFLPQFAFSHGAISNDPLIVFLCSLALLQLLTMWYCEATWPRLALLGLTVGLAILSKTAGLLLLLYSLILVALLTWRSQRGSSGGKIVQQVILSLAIVALVALSVSGWLLWRNWQLYGDVTAANQFISLAGGNRGYSLFRVLRETPGLWRSLFAVFGWFNVLAPGWVYLIWNGIVVAALIGAIFQLWSWLKTRRSLLEAGDTGRKAPLRVANLVDHPVVPAVLLGLWPVMVYAGLVSFMMRTPAGQGRLLFPAVLPLALALAYGLSRYHRRGLYVIAAALAMVTSVFCMVVVLPEAYARPAVITAADMPPEARSFNADMGQGLRLVAAEVKSDIVEPGQWAYMTLYWLADETPPGAKEQTGPQQVIELFGQDIELAGKLQSYHGNGLYPASLWQAGQIVVDSLAVRINDEASVPAEALIFVRLGGEESAVNVGSVKIAPPEWPPKTEAILADLEGIELIGATLDRSAAKPGETVKVILRWQVATAPERDLTTFVHLGQPDQPPLAQADGVPLGGHYPTTLWAAGEVFDDNYELLLPSDLPPGLYPIQIGLYVPEDGSRLQLAVDGVRQPNDAYVTGLLEVRP